MNTVIEFDIKCIGKFENSDKEENILFSLTFDETGECTNRESYNPTKGWTNYNNFRQGWSERDDTLNELLEAIREYSQSPELFEIVSDFQKEDIGKEFKQVYKSISHDFVITCVDVYPEEIQ